MKLASHRVQKLTKWIEENRTSSVTIKQVLPFNFVTILVGFEQDLSTMEIDGKKRVEERNTYLWWMMNVIVINIKMKKGNPSFVVSAMVLVVTARRHPYEKLQEHQYRHHFQPAAAPLLASLKHLRRQVPQQPPSSSRLQSSLLSPAVTDIPLIVSQPLLLLWAANGLLVLLLQLLHLEWQLASHRRSALTFSEESTRDHDTKS